MNDTAETKGNWVQGLHFGTFRKIMRQDYNLDDSMITHVKRFQGDDTKWYDVFFVPLEEDELIDSHRNKILDLVRDEQNNYIGMHLLVRNYHYRTEQVVPKSRKHFEKQVESAEDKKIKAAIRYEENKERIKAYQRARYQQLSQDPEWRERKRAEAREYWRSKHESAPIVSEQARRNDLRKKLQDSIVITAEEERERKIAELMEKDENGIATEIELLELESLLREGEEQ